MIRGKFYQKIRVNPRTSFPTIIQSRKVLKPLGHEQEVQPSTSRQYFPAREQRQRALPPQQDKEIESRTINERYEAKYQTLQARTSVNI